MPLGRPPLRAVAVLAALVALLGALEAGLAGRERGLARERTRAQAGLELGRDVALVRAALATARAHPDRVPSLARSVRARGARMTGRVAGRDRAVLAGALGATDRELAALSAGRTPAADRLDAAEVQPAFAAVAAVAQLDADLARGADVSAGPVTRSLRRGLLLLSGITVALLVLIRTRGTEGTVPSVSRMPGHRYRALVEQSSDAVLVVAADGAVVEATGAAPGLLPDLAVGDRLTTIVHPDDRAALDGRWADLFRAPGARIRASLRVRRGSGWMEVDAVGTNLLEDRHVGAVLVTLRDTGDRTRLERELRHLAYEDPLTGLGNRVALRERLDTLLAERAGARALVAVLFVDLDDFKAINDGFGHPVGDEVLREVGRRIRAAVGAGAFVARPGGDEFVVLAQVRASDEARTLAEVVAGAVDRPLPVSGVELRVGASVGVACEPPGDPARGVDVMRRADIAMYVAKGDGGGVVEYRPEDDPQAADRLALLADLRHALRTGEQLELAVQPQVDVATGRLHAVEALVRWHHPQRGVVPPDAFVALAERAGLIAPLTRRVIDLALAARGEWAAAGLDVHVAVNLSASNLLDATFPGDIAALLETHGVEGRTVCLELTETMLLADEQRAATALADLSALGIELSIDDFGTGHSSLTRLRDLPLDELKVDRSFVSAMHASTEAGAIVRSTVRLAHELGLRVVAEGVELEEHLDALRDVGCDLAQGYLLARPMRTGELVAWAEARSVGVPVAA